MARRSSPSLDSNLKFTCWIVKAASKIHISFLDTPLYLKDDCKTSIMKVYRKTTHTDQYLHLTYGNTTANTNVVWFAPWCTERRLLLPMIQTIKKIISNVRSILCANGDTRWIFQPPQPPPPPPQRKKKAKPVTSSSETKHQFVYVCHKWEEHQEHYSGSLNLMGFTSSTSLLLQKHVLTHVKYRPEKFKRCMWCLIFTTCNENNAWTTIGKTTRSPLSPD